MPSRSRAATAGKNGLHPRSRHRGRYDFRLLVACCPELAAYVSLNAYRDESIDFANPEAVKALNRALLKQVYGIVAWDIPPRYLCPPIPGRADYLHYLADLLGAGNGGEIPRGESVRVLDVGVGANCIYPLIGHREYGWRFVGSDIDPAALACAQGIIGANSGQGKISESAVELRLQPSPTAIFKDVIQVGEVFDLTMCNPPFHISLAAAREGSERKWKNLGRAVARPETPLLNFGGQGAELFCAGGEEAFVGRMIEESRRLPGCCFWFTTLIAKAASLPVVYRALKKAGVRDTRIIEMAQGQKKSRIVAWTFLDGRQQLSWSRERWGKNAGPGCTL